MNILLLHDTINDHKELDKELKKFEKPIVDFNNGKSCISFLTNSEQQNNDRPSILIVLNRVGRQIVPEINSYVNLLFIIIFCTKNDNKIKWVCKYNKIRGIFIDPIELTKCVRQLIKESNLVKSFSCQLVLLDDHPNEIIQQQLYRIDSSLIVFKRIAHCLNYLRSVSQNRPLVLITVNALGRLIVPEINSNNLLQAVFIYCVKDNEKLKWTTKYDKVKGITTNITELVHGIRNEGLYHSALLWHLICLDDRSDEELRDRLYELDPCILTFDQFSICEKYLDSVNKTTIDTKPILFIAINRMGRQFIPEIHSNNRLKAFYIFVSSDSTNDKKIKWTTKYNKIKHVCTNLDQLTAYIKQDAAAFAPNIIQNEKSVADVSRSSTESTSFGRKRQIIQDYLVCWLDSSIDGINSVFHLRQIANTVHLFTDPNECVDFLTDIFNTKIFLIISDDFAEHIVPLIYDISQLNSIYILCRAQQEKYAQWAKEYFKVKGIFTEISAICEGLKQNIDQSNHNSVAISFMSTSADSSIEMNLDRLDPSFMYTHLLKDILLDMVYDDTAIKEFANYCREQFIGKDSFLQQIDKFEQNYYNHSPIYWYTSDVSIYSTLNKALRTLDIEIIIKMGFFIRDLHRHIKQLHAEQFNDYKMQPFTVYRGQGLLEADFEQMMKTKGGLISFNNFLSTSMDRNVSLMFAESNQCTSDLVGILFIIQIDPSISSTPFASIRDLSSWGAEDEVLFSMSTIFRINTIRNMGENNRLFQVDLTLTDNNDRELQALTECISNSIQAGTGLQRLGALMIEMGQYDKAANIYETLLNAAQPDEDQAGVSSVHNQLGAIYSQIGKMHEALDHYMKSLEIKLTYLSPDDSSLSPVYSNIGSVLRNLSQLNEAVGYMERALNIELQDSLSNPLNIASYRNNIGLVLTDQNRHNEALTHYEQALGIQQQYLPPNHPALATSYNNIGTIYNELGEYTKALSFYEKSLAIMQQSLPPNHPDLATSYNNIGSVYNELQEYSEALSFYEKSLEIMQNSLPSNHPSLATSYNNIGALYNEIQEYSKALSCYEKSLDIMQHSLPSNHPSLADVLRTIALIRSHL